MSVPIEPGEPQVGAFRRGTEGSRFALARYLVARVIADAVGRSLLAVALVLTALAVVIFIWWLKWLAVLVFVVAIVVLLFRAVFLAILRRVMAQGADAESRVRGLVADSRSDLRRELKRIGLPGSPLGLPLLAWRLVGRRRRQTWDRLRQFDVDRVVPPGRLDELHLAVTDGLAGRRRPQPPTTAG